MKNLTWIICLLALASCKKNDNVVVDNGPICPTNSYSDAKSTWISIDSTQWYLTRLYSGGEVHVKLHGTTNADKITIRTSGDGVLTDNLLTIDANKGFSTDVINSFSVSAVPAGSFVSSTRLIAYRGSDTLTVTLTSGQLKY